MRWKIAQWFEEKWWSSYLEKKDVEGYLEWKRNYWISFLQKLDIELTPKDMVLDAGCGPAGIFMLEESASFTALDPLIEKYQTTLNHFNKGMYPKVTFCTGTIESAQLEQSFDQIFCINAINHVEDMNKSLNRITQWTKTGTKLVLSIDAHRFSFIKWLFRIIPLDILHPHQFSLDEYQAALLQRNFQIQKTVLIKPGNIFNYHAILAVAA